MDRKAFLESLPSRVALACDVSTQEGLSNALDGLEESLACAKIGRQAMNALDVGPAINTPLRRGINVFIDGKEHDIGNTVTATVKAMQSRVEKGEDLAHSGKVLFMNMHVGLVAASTIRGFVEVVEGIGALPLGVAVLTDIGEDEIRQDFNFGHGGPSLMDVMLRFADKAVNNGMKGMVASALEAAALRKEFGNDLLIVTPAIRPMWSKKNEQERVTTPTEAIQAGADILVVGRPIISKEYDSVAPTPRARLELIIVEVQVALAA